MPAKINVLDIQIKDEIKRTSALIESVTGVAPAFFRPPYISVSANMYDAIPLPFICGRGCNDWEDDKDADYRYEHMKQATENGTIYLLHVTDGNKATLEACERIIPELQAQGYEFVNLPTLFETLKVERNIPHSLWTLAKMMSPIFDSGFNFFASLI